MNLLKTSLILYPSIPGGIREKQTTFISNEPIVPEGASWFRRSVMVFSLFAILEIIFIMIMKD